MRDSSSWNHLGRKIAVGVFFAGAVGWLLFWSLQNRIVNKKNERKKNSAKEKQRSTSKGRQGVSATDLEAALEKKVTKDGDCVSCREKRIKSPKKNKTPTKDPEFVDPIPAPPDDATLPGLEPVSPSAYSRTSSSSSLSAADSANSSWDKLVLPPPPKKSVRDVPPTPSNSLTILLKNKKSDLKSDGGTSSDAKSDKDDLEKTQEDL